MRRTWLLPFTLLTLACGPGGDDTATATTTGTTPATTDATDSASTSQDPTSTGTPGTSTGPGTTEPGTSTPGTTGPGPTSEPGTSTTVPGTTGTTGDDTGPVVPGECQSDADCKLFEDCCECKGVPADDETAICKLECDQSICDALGVDAAVCRLGRCIAERLPCEPTQVMCPMPSPDCPKGQVPGVGEGCWTGQCVPAEICDVVPDCDICPDGWMCVTKVAFGPQGITCEPIPADCDGEPSCECAGEAVCVDGFTFCSDPGGDELNCECINC